MYMSQFPLGQREEHVCHKKAHMAEIREFEVKVLLVHLVQLFAIPWTVAHQAPLSMEFSRQEYWSGLPLSSPADPSTQGSNLGLLHCRQILYHLSHQGYPIREWLCLNTFEFLTLEFIISQL